MKLGNYTIPDMRLFPKIFDAMKLVYETYRFEEASNEDALAQLLGHKSANSGAWLSKRADMRLYGLLEPRALKITPLAEKLTYGTEQEKREATKKAVLNIPLWKELNNRFGVELPDSNFWVQLQQITGVDSLEAQKYADFVRKSYLGDISHIELEIEPKIEGAELEAGKIDKSTAISEGVLGRVIVKDAGYIDIKDKTTYEIAKAYLKLFADKLGIEETSEEEG